MAQDYKHRRRRGRQQQPGWIWMLGGFAMGLVVALAVYLANRSPDQGSSRPVAAVDAGRSASAAAEERELEPEPERRRYDFYDMLPRFELVIPERERDVRADERPEPLSKPGKYVLQAGSFQQFADADRRKANLAMLGIESRIQKVTIDNDQTWHRVRIGPVADLNELNMLRRRLRGAEIEVLVIRTGD